MLAEIPYIQPWQWPDPPLFGAIAIRGFGLMVVIAIVVGWQPLKWRARKHGLNVDDVSDFVFFVVVVGFIGSHLVDVFFYHPHELAKDPLLIFKVWKGISSLGGWTSGLLGAYCFFRFIKRDLAPKAWCFVDSLTYAWPFAWIFARAGCAWVHDHPGKLAPGYWTAVRFPASHPYAGLRHDLGLYEMIFMIYPIMMFLLFTWMEKRRGRMYHPCFYLGAFLVIYAPVRFCLDALRLVDKTYPVPLGGVTMYLTPGHFMAVMMFVAGVTLLIMRPGRDLVPTGDEPDEPSKKGEKKTKKNKKD